MSLKLVDPQIARAIDAEMERQRDNLVMIASENYTSKAVIEAQASIMTNKYAEGYPGKRYYGGCENVDTVENLAIGRVKRLFKAEFANVQPHSGSQANMAVYFSFLKPGETILGMDLAHGGHLTHGSSASFSGRLYRAVFYGVDPQTHRIDFDQIKSLARSYRPKLIIAGASSYPRVIDFEAFRKIADDVDAYLMADMAHIAGLIAAGLHPSPIPLADFVTSTTHKTLRGPRGGFILAKARYAKQIDSQIFPGIQGGPMMHTIAAKAVAFQEAMSPEFADYQRQVVTNAKALGEELVAQGLELVTGGSDNHIVLLNLSRTDLTGADAEDALGKAGIVANKNSVPFDKRGPKVTSGIRLGTPALTTRGLKDTEVKAVAQWIAKILERPYDMNLLQDIQSMVHSLCSQFPIHNL
ncbi:MAG: serine hydroxymethyltransferase [Deltaproteobacteria bacterium]|nr:serine hydroxymethyltransferase [Deltaproteobacteria bacterium]MBW2340790.1 serine hydroxymethyltransferase [Deltaproteobacteria bacterium]